MRLVCHIKPILTTAHGLSSDHRLLFGGRASYSTLPPPNLRGTMQRRMTRVFPQLAGVKLDYVWGGYVDISLSLAPHWGRLADNVYFAQGFSGHGIAATGLAGRVIAEAIQGQSERLDVFGKLRQRAVTRWTPPPKTTAQ